MIKLLDLLNEDEFQSEEPSSFSNEQEVIQDYINDIDPRGITMADVMEDVINYPHAFQLRLLMELAKRGLLKLSTGLKVPPKDVPQLMNSQFDIAMDALANYNLNENEVDYYIDRDGNEFQTVDVNYLQYPGNVTVKYVGGKDPVEYKGNFEADLKSGMIKRLNSKIDEAFFIGEDDIDEYDVENEQDIKEFVEFMREYQQQLNEADCDCLLEAKYQGRTVPLGKPMRGDSKKFKVYVKNPKTGKVVKVNFGAKGMNIKKNNPVRRKAFRARHNCANPGPRTKARYWSCRKW
jgi:hypothetical protein